MSAYDWVAVDWGTSRLRLWCLSGDEVIDRRQSEDGMGRLSAGGFEAALLALLPDLPDTRDVPGAPLPVLVCGMAGSRQGWFEAPYVAAPCKPPSGGVRVAGTSPRLDVRILPGVKQTAPADVMRGEETQIAGFMALTPQFDGILCLPGTHTKWVQVSAGEIVSFRTFMTGEMFALLAQHSVLRHALAAEGWDAAAFDAGVARAMARPAGLAADLFALRAEALLEDLPPQAARARLSGLLIGAELAAARPYWLGQNVAILGADAMARAYASALQAQGVPALLANADQMTLAGLKAARRAAAETA